jgi:hypothetical protein
MKTVSANHRLLRRKSVYYYRRRVPTHLVKAIGSKFIQLSLGTNSATQAKKLRTAKDLEWDARFDDCSKSLAAPGSTSSTSQAPPLSEDEVIRLVHDYVERMDERSRKRLTADPPHSEPQKTDMKIDVEVGAQILRDRDDPRAQQWIYSTGKEILLGAGKAIDDGSFSAGFAELVRRALLELDARYLSRLRDDHSRVFFDQLFDPARTAQVTFGELAHQYLEITVAEATANRTSQKWIDKVNANVALIRAIIGDKTPVHAVDYDACLRVRSMLARLPSNRTKLYPDLSLEEAAKQGAIDKKPLLSPVTQQNYLAALRDILDLAAKKRLIPVNPAEGMRPLKRDTVPDAEKRLPFSLDQIKTFFSSDFYAECAKHPVPYAYDKPGWRFWLPLISIFMGMRPNEIAQLLTTDLKRTSSGTWYLDVATTSDEEDGESAMLAKTLKTAASHRKIPLHPELVAIGLIQFVEIRKKQTARGCSLT